MYKKNPSNRCGSRGSLGRSGGIRTRGLLVPNQTRYQAALHLDDGANEGTRTPDLLITNQLLYRLSYIGKSSTVYYIKRTRVCLGGKWTLNRFFAGEGGLGRMGETV